MQENGVPSSLRRRCHVSSKKFVRFSCSKSAITQSAFGTSKMTINGEKCVLPCVYRLMDNEALIDRGIEYMLQEGVPESKIPHRRTLGKILEAIPAKKLKALKGINPYLVSFKI